MRWQAFQRARKFGQRSAPSRYPIYLRGVLSALLFVALILLLGVIVELLDHTHPPRMPSWLGEFLAQSTLPAWQHLAILIAAGWIVAAVTARLIYKMECAIQRLALAATLPIRTELHQQAVRLGAADMFSSKDPAAARLFDEHVELVRAGLVAWWRVWPQAIVLLALLICLALAVEPWLAVAVLLFANLAWLAAAPRRRQRRSRQVLLADRARQHGRLLTDEMRQARFLGNFFPIDRVAGETFDERLRRYHGALCEQNISSAANGPWLFLLVLTGADIVLLLAGINILRTPPQSTLATMVILSAALASCLYPLRRIERMTAILPQAEHAAAEIFAYLDVRPKVGQLPDARPIPRLSQRVEFDHVALADAGGQKLLQDVSFSLPSGSRTVIFSSAPETPLIIAGLFSRFYDPLTGAVRFDGHDLRHATLQSVRDQISWIVSEGLLVTGTVAENIACGDRRYTQADIIDAAKQVHAYDFIQTLPQGFETIVGEHGASLSATETMRIGLARGVLRKPTIVIVEEPAILPDITSTELLADSIRRAAVGRMLIVLARRLATLRSAERILLFHEGQLIGDGTHAELLLRSELYRHLNYVRFNEFGEKVR